MKHYRTEAVPATTREVQLRSTCDMCEAEIDTYGYDVDEVTIKVEEGSRFPEGTNLEIMECDLCGDCFRAKVIPWLESQGVKMQKRELSY